MSLTDLAGVQLPPSTAAWIDRLLLVCIGLSILWIVLEVIGFAYRRSYNLTPVATTGSKDIKPDFLKVDRAAQERLLERGRDFGRPAEPVARKAARLGSLGMIASGLVTLVSAAFLAFGRVEEFDATWRNLSAKDRFVAIVQSHPVGFTIALAMTVAAIIRFSMSLRRAR
jgi:hypothetical protein